MNLASTPPYVEPRLSDSTTTHVGSWVIIIHELSINGLRNDEVLSRYFNPQRISTENPEMLLVKRL